MTELITTQHAIDTVTTGAGDNPALVYLAALGSPHSRRSQRAALDTIARILTGNEGADCTSIPWHLLRFQHTQAIRAALLERYAPATVNRILAALRGTVRAAWRLGQMSADDYHTAAELKAARGETVPAGRSIPSGEIAALLATCEDNPPGVRDAAIIALLYAGGLRRAELVALDLGDYDASSGALRVRGKGRKERLTPVANGAARALGDWLAVRGAAPGALFHSLGNRSKGARMTTQAVYYMLRKRAELAGVPELSPHDFRRTFVGDLLDAGADISTVQRLAGHANVTTTARYDRRGDAAKRKAVELLHVPYRKRTVID